MRSNCFTFIIAFIQWIQYAEEDDILLEIKDNDIGIPGTYRSHIYDVFIEAERAGADGEKHSGLAYHQ